jgi:hypothetical protein
VPEKTEKKNSSMGWFHMVTYNKLFLSGFVICACCGRATWTIMLFMSLDVVYVLEFWKHSNVKAYASHALFLFASTSGSPCA